MASTHVCTCCFLDHVSILRHTTNQSAETVKGSEKQTAPTDNLFAPWTTGGDIFKATNRPDKLVDDGLFDLPERLVQKRAVKSSDTFVVIGVPGESRTKTNYAAGSNYSSAAGSELARRISSVLEEQKLFLQRLNVSVNTDGNVELGDKDRESGSSVDVTTVSHVRPPKDRMAFFASGDQISVSMAKATKCARKLSKKPIYLNGGPRRDRSEGKEFLSLDDAEVEMLYFPENEIKASCSSVEVGTDSGSGSSAYATATDSRSEELGRTMFAAADRLCRADSKQVFRVD